MCFYIPLEMIERNLKEQNIYYLKVKILDQQEMKYQMINKLIYKLDTTYLNSLIENFILWNSIFWYW